jgi:hypothetical protein
MTIRNTEGQAVFDVGIGTLSSNKSLFIHAGTYTAGYQQRGSVTVKEKNSPGTGQTFNFGPTSSGGYTEMLNTTFSVKDDTFYEVTVKIENDQGSGGKTWSPSTIMSPTQLSAGNYNERVVTSEDLKDPDDVNDTVVRLVWFTKP